MSDLIDPDDSPFAQLQASFRDLGYDVSEQRHGRFVVTYLDESTWNRHFADLDHLNRFKRELDHSTTWRLDLTTGDVQVDREAGMITPHDGSEPFSITHPLINGWSGTRHMGDRYRFADDVYVSTQPSEKPSLGGAWHKWV